MSNVLQGADKEETLQNLSECLGGLNRLLTSDVMQHGDKTGRDRFVIQQVVSCLDAVEHVREVLDREQVA